MLQSYSISFPIVPNRFFSGRKKNNRHFGYPETKITYFKILGTRLGTTLHHCRLILETEMEPGTKSCFHYLCLGVGRIAFGLDYRIVFAQQDLNLGDETFLFKFPIV